MTVEDEDRGPTGEGQPAHEARKAADGDLEMIRERQRARARIVALLLGAFVVLLFFITIAKTGMNW